MTQTTEATRPASGDRPMIALAGVSKRYDGTPAVDRLTGELRGLNRRLDSGESYAPLVHELRRLNESLQALAYAALGHRGPQVRRRRAE